MGLKRIASVAAVVLFVVCPSFAGHGDPPPCTDCSCDSSLPGCDDGGGRAGGGGEPGGDAFGASNWPTAGLDTLPGEFVSFFGQIVLVLAGGYLVFLAVRRGMSYARRAS